MGRAPRLGSYERGVLVLILAPGSRPRGERGGGQGEGVRRTGAGTRQTGKDYNDVYRPMESYPIGHPGATNS